MFGSVFRMQAQPGKKQELIKTMTEDDGRSPGGMRAAYVYDTGGDELFGVAVFEDEKSYRANAESPEQDKEYRRMRDLLVADPEWHDGTITPWPGNKP
jgi:hypothetical protein